MQVQFSPEVQAKLDQLAVETGRAQEEFVQDAMAGYLDELVELGGTLNRRYDEIKSGVVELIPGDEVMSRLAAKSASRRSQLA